MVSIRSATHAGTWYSAHANDLSQQLLQYLESSSRECVSKARIIISPHAGYRYCGPTMAHAYASLDLKKKPKRIFILGPSHHVYFKNEVLVSHFQEVETPLGNLNVDTEVCETLVGGSGDGRKLFRYMDKDTDEDEHSLEMQFPMLAQALLWRQIPLSEVKVVPLMVSHNSVNVDTSVGSTLAKYMKDEENLFIISSDFCHWGRRFSYTGYVGSTEELENVIAEETEVEMLTTRSKLSHHQVPIWKSIEIMDKYAMHVLSRNAKSPENLYSEWKQYLEISGNTICGEKPISVIACALASVGYKDFEWPAYSQSSNVNSINESSVSYAAGYGCL